MNICQVIISDGWGGAGEVVYELSRHLRDKGENVSIILNEEMVKHYADLKNIKLFSIGPLYPPPYTLLNMKRNSDKWDLKTKIVTLIYIYSDELIRYKQYNRLKNDVKQILADNRIDIIHSHLASSAFLVANLDTRVPIINTVHGEHNLIGNVKKTAYVVPFYKLKARKFKKTLRKMDMITDVSNFSIKKIKDWGPKLKIAPKVIYNGISLADFNNSSMLDRKLEGRFNILYPGGSIKRKGGDLLLSALVELKNKNISDLHLYISGYVPEYHMLKQMVINLGLEAIVTFTGFLSKEEYRTLLNSIDILVMPSSEEAFGLVYIEAMAFGKAVVAAKTGGIPELVQDGRNGILVKLDPKQVAEAILYLYQHEDIRKEMGLNNISDVAKFDWNIITDQYIKLYSKMNAKLS